MGDTLGCAAEVTPHPDPLPDDRECAEGAEALNAACMSSSLL